MKTLWQHIKSIFQKNEKDTQVKEVEKVEVKEPVAQPAVVQIVGKVEVKEPVVQVAEVKEQVIVDAEPKKDYVEIKLEHIKEDKPKRKKAVKKEKLVEVIPTPTKSKGKRGPKKSNKS